MLRRRTASGGAYAQLVADLKGEIQSPSFLEDRKKSPWFRGRLIHSLDQYLSYFLEEVELAGLIDLQELLADPTYGLLQKKPGEGEYEDVGTDTGTLEEIMLDIVQRDLMRDLEVTIANVLEPREWKE